MLADDLE